MPGCHAVTLDRLFTQVCLCTTSDLLATYGTRQTCVFNFNFVSNIVSNKRWSRSFDHRLHRRGRVDFLMGKS